MNFETAWVKKDGMYVWGRFHTYRVEGKKTGRLLKVGASVAQMTNGRWMWKTGAKWGVAETLEEAKAETLRYLLTSCFLN
jgi:hypothetical protein